MSAAITAVGLSKRYRMPSAPDGWLDALKDVSFEIQEGEAVGLIGRNGAGKSTLLRILSRVTRPTSGHADVAGNVGALLEVGTGFHPDLTGRENAFLSGAILGLSKREVAARFDEIVAFAEIEPFIDTPVKRYSSGMYARLGFAVAAHLRPSILIVDEVLAVGDLAFQAKCLAHMHRLTDSGTTVLFVSHNLLAVADLCRRSLVLKNGKLAFDGDSAEGISAYRRALRPAANASSEQAGLTIAINGTPVNGVCRVTPNASIALEVAFDDRADARRENVILNLVIETSDGRPAVHLRSDVDGANLVLAPSTRLGIRIDDLALAPGAYSLWVRAVSLDPANAFIEDSDRVVLEVAGETPLTAITLPRHEFVQLS